MFTESSGSTASTKLSVSGPSGTGSGTCVGSTVAARGFLACDETVEESTLDLAAPCEFLVVRLNGGFAAGWRLVLWMNLACVGFGLEILNDFS